MFKFSNKMLLNFIIFLISINKLINFDFILIYLINFIISFRVKFILYHKKFMKLHKSRESIKFYMKL